MNRIARKKDSALEIRKTYKQMNEKKGRKALQREEI